MLKVTELESGYGPMQVLWKPSLQVKKGTIKRGDLLCLVGFGAGLTYGGILIRF